MAVGSGITLENPPNKKYKGESDYALINGMGGTINYQDESWQGFEAEDLVAIIDLGSAKAINSVEVRFLQSQVFWIFLPYHIQIEHSIDGNNFELIYEDYPSNDFSFEQKIISYKANLDPLKSRFIRVKGYNIDECPDYHPGAGGPSWIFSDEIIIN